MTEKGKIVRLNQQETETRLTAEDLQRHARADVLRSGVRGAQKMKTRRKVLPWYQGGPPKVQKDRCHD